MKLAYTFIGMLFLAQSLFSQSNHPPLISYDFKPEESKVLPGLSTDIGTKYGCNIGILEEDKIGNLAIASELYQNGCYTDGRYNHKDFPVEFGKFVSSDGSVSVEAYRFSLAQKKATQFLGSPHRIHLKFEKKQDYVIYSFIQGAIYVMEEIPASKVVPGEYHKISNFSLSGIGVEVIAFVAPKDLRTSVYKSINSVAEGAKVFSSSNVNVFKTRYDITGEIYDSQKGFTGGPGSHANVYGFGRQFFYYPNGYDLDVLWEDKSNNSVKLSRVDLQTNEKRDINMSARPGRLAAATTDDDGNLYYLVMTGDVGKIGAWIYKANRNGKVLNSNALSCAKSGGMNIWNYDSDEIATLAYKNGKLGLIISRTMHKSNDGLNHQGAIAVTIDANSLEVIKNLGQTSGHSFDNIIYPDPNGGFIGMDLGDNYPRGINMHKIGDMKRSKLVYTFKTAHGTSAKSPAGRSYPFYKEISRGDQKFYQWSNDNHTYSELGDVIDLGDGLGVFFIGEPDPNGKAINNGRAIGYLHDSRNIGFVKISKDFTNYGEEVVLSKGISESGGFYTFGGRWSEQENKGISWLTKYNDSETSNVSRLKALKYKNEILLFWEQWTPFKYVSTFMMKVDLNGKPKGAPIDLGTHLRLNRRDEPIIMNGRVIFLSGNKNDSKLEVIEIAIK
ncbi:MAG: hypothetical protein NXI20_07915 [bacterium]|nr:hypothetical protein [bacterium]